MFFNAKPKVHFRFWALLYCIDCQQNVFSILVKIGVGRTVGRTLLFLKATGFKPLTFSVLHFWFCSCVLLVFRIILLPPLSCYHLPPPRAADTLHFLRPGLSSPPYLYFIIKSAICNCSSGGSLLISCCVIGRLPICGAVVVKVVCGR